MVKSLRNGPNIGSSSVYEQKKSRTASHELTAGAKEKVNPSDANTNVEVALSLTDKVKSLSSEPPVNIQLVNEIRQKLSEGRYPIDLDGLSSKMFESIKNG